MNQYLSNEAATDAATEPEGAAFIEPTREELAAYVPRPDARRYDGPRDRDGEPFPSCFRRWQESRLSIFARVDLACMEGKNDAPVDLERAARALVKMATEAPSYGNENPDFGRFEFSSYSDTARDIQAAFRLCRVALDFLRSRFSGVRSRRNATPSARTDGVRADARANRLTFWRAARR